MILLKSQSIYPTRLQAQAPSKLGELLVGGYVNQSPGPRGKDWYKSQFYLEDKFIFAASEGCHRARRDVFCHTQEDFIKFHFRLTGDRSSIVFNGFGEYEFDRPQLFIVSGPPEMVKMDRPNSGSYSASVTLMVVREFFEQQMGLDLEALPEVLKRFVLPDQRSFALHCEPLTPELAFAVRAVLGTACASELNSLYHHAKAVELMCLVINRLWLNERSGTGEKALPLRKVNRLYEVRELLDRRFTDPLTLTSLARETGLGKTVLTSGFLQLFGVSVFDYIQQKRMSLAHELLRNRDRTVTDIAEAVGYSHLSNFSAAFRNYFGCSPKDIRTR